MAYMFHYENLTVLYQYLFAGILLASLLICGGLLEQKSWVVPLEYLRLLLVLISLNFLYYFQYVDWFSIMLICSSTVFLIWTIWFFRISSLLGPLALSPEKTV